MLYFTICARNYLAYALTLRDSLKAAEPEAAFIVFLSDASDGVDIPGLHVVGMDALGIDDLDDLTFRYTVMELSTAIKPFCFGYAFDVLNYQEAVFLDPDIAFFAGPTEVRDAFDAGASAVLTPHLLEPLEDDRSPSNIDILASGTFNLGFAGFANQPEARYFLDWWGRQLRASCYVDLPRGLFVDQKFADFAPSFLERLSIIRHPGYNVAYWNLAGRAVTRSGPSLMAAGSPLVFFHFSGIDPLRPEIFSRHQNRFSLSDIGAAAALVEAYTEKLLENGHAHWSRVPYQFGRFHDGLAIPLPVRRARKPGTGRAADFEMFDAAYWNTASEDVDQLAGAPISRLMLEYYRIRPDLQRLYPLATSRGRRLFHDWFMTCGMAEYGLTWAQAPSGRRAHPLISPLSRLLMRIRLKAGL
jgi:hypothetical protein